MMLSAPATLLTAIVTLLAVVICIGTAIMVARVRTANGVQPPAMSGHPAVERALRVQGNTVESFAALLPALWLAALYFQGWAPPLLGLLWCLGRVVYAIGYMAAPERRHVGFGISMIAVLGLLVLAIVGIAGAWGVATAT